MMDTTGSSNRPMNGSANNGPGRSHDPSQQHKRNRSRRGSRGGSNGGSNNTASTNGATNNSNNNNEPPKKRRRNRKKKGNNGGNNNNSNTATDMEIDSVHEAAPPVAAAAAAAKAQFADPSFMTAYKFADQPPEAIHPNTLMAITNVMKLERLTEVQHKTMQESRVTNGNNTFNDILGRARTGTGKTVAFLMPAIQTVLSSSNSSNKNSIQVLVISPTRELASQIQTQADQILTYHPQLSVQIIMGGTNMKSDVNRFSNKLPTILVATPGRMKDHLQNTTLKNGTRFADCLSGLQVLVLDECDQLLEQGFQRDIFAILDYLPPVENRQTLLFSATMPKELREVMARAMKPSYKTVDCIHDRDLSGNNKETNAHVQQSHVILPPGMDRLVVSVVEVVLQAMKEPEYKIIAFFPTARLVGYFAEVVNLGIRKYSPKAFPPIVEIHSRKSQANRNRASDKFRAATSAILFTSDVSARGVDYPGVTTVIQFGLPDSREQYIHRLGRTGRAGKAGRGWLVLADYERTFLQELKKGGNSGGVDVPVDAELEELFSAPPSQEVLDLITPVLRDDIGKEQNKELVKSAQQAYQAWLGFYKDRTRRMVGNKSKAEMVQMANTFAKLCGLTEQPALLKKTVGKMGLKGVPGIKTTNQL